MKHRPEIYGRLFGIAFILSFLSYALGTYWLDAAVTQIGGSGEGEIVMQWGIWGGLLTAFFHTLFNIILLSAMYELLHRRGRLSALLYLLLGLSSTILLAMGGLVRMLPFVDVSIMGAPFFEKASEWTPVLTSSDFLLYQSGMALWASGGLLLIFLLYRSRSIPSWLSIWGLLGYVLFLAGTFLELLGFTTALLHTIAGGVFELALSCYFIFRSYSDWNQDEDVRTVAF